MDSCQIECDLTVHLTVRAPFHLNLSLFTAFCRPQPLDLKAVFLLGHSAACQNPFDCIAYFFHVHGF